MVLKANDRRTSCPCHEEFRGPRSDYVRQERRSMRLRDCSNRLEACREVIARKKFMRRMSRNPKTCSSRKRQSSVS
ncbi:hypothetical protein TNCV_305541 [Trichonephila clavipes]|nr:hypothetical protein TNCV_305541 [Trichonephila clavipes]